MSKDIKTTLRDNIESAFNKLPKGKTTLKLVNVTLFNIATDKKLSCLENVTLFVKTEEKIENIYMACALAYIFDVPLDVTKETPFSWLFVRLANVVQSIWMKIDSNLNIDPAYKEFFLCALLCVIKHIIALSGVQDQYDYVSSVDFLIKLAKQSNKNKITVENILSMLFAADREYSKFPQHVQDALEPLHEFLGFVYNQISSIRGSHTKADIVFLDIMQNAVLQAAAMQKALQAANPTSETTEPTALAACKAITTPFIQQSDVASTKIQNEEVICIEDSSHVYKISHSKCPFCQKHASSNMNYASSEGKRPTEEEEKPKKEVKKRKSKEEEEKSHPMLLPLTTTQQIESTISSDAVLLARVKTYIEQKITEDDSLLTSKFNTFYTKIEGSLLLELEHFHLNAMRVKPPLGKKEAGPSIDFYFYRSLLIFINVLCMIHVNLDFDKEAKYLLVQKQSSQLLESIKTELVCIETIKSIQSLVDVNPLFYIYKRFLSTLLLITEFQNTRKEQEDVIKDVVKACKISGFSEKTSYPLNNRQKKFHVDSTNANNALYFLSKDKLEAYKAKMELRKKNLVSDNKNVKQLIGAVQQEPPKAKENKFAFLFAKKKVTTQ